MRFYWLSFFFFSSRRRHTRFDCDWSSDVCSSDLKHQPGPPPAFEWFDCTQRVRRRQTKPRQQQAAAQGLLEEDRKSTRLNSSHSQISYAVFCLKKKID